MAFTLPDLPYPHDALAPFMSKEGCNGSGPEFGAGIKYAIEKGWLDLHESGTYVKLLTPSEELLTS